MAGASDKARFFQEQSVPELQEFARKNTFTREEIASITKKRSDFEHLLNARGSKPQDYARYIEYEMNLESLRRKRVRRLGVKLSNHTGQRRIILILDRATKKFPGDVGLWMQYITFAQKQSSNRKVSKLLTSVLRLHPTKPELWIYAATMRCANIMEARSYMQRGLRFCESSKELWIEYAKLEMIHVSKVAGRRRILGLNLQMITDKTRKDTEDGDDGMVNLPATTAEDDAPAQELSNVAQEDALTKVSNGPALSGAIPMAIFDAAMKRFKGSDELCQQFFDMVAEFYEVPCQQKILSHMIDFLCSIAPKNPRTLIRWIQQPVIGVDVMTPEFPALFGRCLDRMKKSFETLTPNYAMPETARPMSSLGQQVITWLLSYQNENLDADVRKVMRTMIEKVESMSGGL